MRNKYKFIFLIVFIFSLEECLAQAKPPVAGSYYCHTTTFTVGAGGLDKNFNDVNGNNALQVLPAFFGDIVIDGKGNYKLSGSGKGGQYTFDKTKGKLNFSGELKSVQVSEYKSTGFVISQGGFGYICNCKGVTPEPDAVVKNPNNGFGGIIIASQAYNSVDYLDLQNANTINTYSYLGNTKVAFKGKSLHLQNVYDALSKTIHYPGVEIKDYKGNKIVSYEGKGNNGKEWQTGAYYYGVLSPDGSKFILSGKSFLTHAAGPYAYTEYKNLSYSVINAATGNEIKVFDGGGTQGKWPAGWLPDGGIILPNAEGGIDITNANFSNQKTIYKQQVVFAKCSPDGKKILFQKGTQLFTVNIDGSNETRFTNNEVDLTFAKTTISDACWSPDSKAVAIMMPDKYLSNKYNALIVAGDGKKATMVKNKTGSTITFIRPSISWINNQEASTEKLQQNIPNDNGSTQPAEENNPGTKVKPNPYMIYTPAKQNTEPYFTKAWEIYTQVMEADLENFNDVAAAITYVVSLNYMQVNNINSISTPTTEKIYNQIANNLLLDDNFKKLSSSDKQTMAEQIILDGLETAQAAATKDSQKIKETAIRLMKKYIGKNAAKMRVTDNGIEF
jgi:hypothetical protein